MKWRNFICGWIVGDCIHRFKQDSYGSLEGYIEYLKYDAVWIQAHPMLWLFVGILAAQAAAWPVDKGGVGHGN